MRIWIDILQDHTELIARIRLSADSSEVEAAKLDDQLTRAINERCAAEIDMNDDSEDGMVNRMAFMLERYAALLQAGDAPERTDFERDWPDVVALAQGEGAGLLADFIKQERTIRAKLPIMPSSLER